MSIDSVQPDGCHRAIFIEIASADFVCLAMTKGCYQHTSCHCERSEAISIMG